MRYSYHRLCTEAVVDSLHNSSSRTGGGRDNAITGADESQTSSGALTDS